MSKIPDTPENRALLAKLDLDYDRLGGELPKWMADAFGLVLGRPRRIIPTPEQLKGLDAACPAKSRWKPSGKASPETFQAALNESLKGTLDYKEAPGCRKMICQGCGAEFYDPNPANVAYRRSVDCPVCGRSFYVEAEPSERR